MRTRAVITSIFASIGVLLIGWQAGQTATTTTVSTPQASGTTARTSTTTSAATSAAASSASPSVAPAAPVGPKAKDGTYAGSSVNTQFGSVQVQVTISGGAITDVTPLHLTDQGGRSVQISNYAAPILHDEVLQAQSSRVSNVSGATYTTDAYLSSLQSALDKAGF